MGDEIKEVFLKDIRHEYSKDERICDWEFISIPNSYVRVYYKPYEEIGLGFYFYSLKAEIDYAKNEWQPETSTAEALYNGIAYFDGVRHLYMGDEATENDGYDYYPKLEDHIAILKTIRELEIKYCRDYEK